MQEILTSNNRYALHTVYLCITLVRNAAASYTGTLHTIYVACINSLRFGFLFTDGGGRKVGENKALTSKKSRYSPYTKEFGKCRICKTSVHQVGSHYCQACAYKKGENRYGGVATQLNTSVASYHNVI